MQYMYMLIEEDKDVLLIILLCIETLPVKLVIVSCYNGILGGYMSGP